MPTVKSRHGVELLDSVDGEPAVSTRVCWEEQLTQLECSKHKLRRSHRRNEGVFGAQFACKFLRNFSRKRCGHKPSQPMPSDEITEYCLADTGFFVLGKKLLKNIPIRCDTDWCFRPSQGNFELQN